MKYTNEQLANICANTQCRFCKPDVKRECLQNTCWSAAEPYDRKPPSVYYGVISRDKNKNKEVNN